MKRDQPRVPTEARDSSKGAFIWETPCGRKNTTDEEVVRGNKTGEIKRGTMGVGHSHHHNPKRSSLKHC